MTRTFFDESVPPRMRQCIALHGWWFALGDEHFVRVRRSGRQFVSTIYDGPWKGTLSREWKMTGPGRAVIGLYPTLAAAREAAANLLGIEGPRLCKWKDVIEARREMVRQEAQVPPVIHRNPDLLLPRPPFAWDRFAHEHDAEATRIDAAFVAAYPWDKYVAEVDAATTDDERLALMACFAKELELWRQHRAEDVMAGIGGHRD